MMRWRSWPPQAKKFETKLVVRRMEAPPSAVEAAGSPERLTSEVRWKGSRAHRRSLRRRTVRMNRTREEEVKGGAVVEWDEEFKSVCSLVDRGDGTFNPFEIEFTILNVTNQGPKNKASVLGVASLDLSEFITVAIEKEIEIVIPLLPQIKVATEFHPLLHLTLSLLKMRTAQDSFDIVQGCIMPLSCNHPPSRDAFPSEKDELSALKAGLRKVKQFTDFVSTRKTKESSHEDDVSQGRFTDRSDDADYTYPFDTDSLDDELEHGELEDDKGENFRKSFHCETMPSANYIGGPFYPDLVIDGEHEDWVYYSHRKSDVGFSNVEVTKWPVGELSPLQTSKRSILPWRKRKLSFRSPKAKGEPLLKKTYGENGGDDIDFDRRQLSSSDESLQVWRHTFDDLATNGSSPSEFGDDNFAVGNWELKELVSRDGHMKLSAQVFFASIDQRSERAAGEGACTALVAVIADWLQSNRETMPIKSQFDSLIREGSLEWRNLCENQTYRDRFPDKHFDLETVLDAKIRMLSVLSEKSFVGFFSPEGANDCSNGFDFLHGAMSFDSIWDEISQCSSIASPQHYIVSWNDHFFVLKVESEAYYIIDTLGERLHEGCNQAYILKFDENTSIHRVSSGDKPTSSEASADGIQESQQRDNVKEISKSGQLEAETSDANGGSGGGDDDDDQKKQLVVCKGKESCKEYIKSFLAAIPIRELQIDIKKGRMASTMLHHRLQIEFHYTASMEEIAEILRPVEPTSYTSTPSMKLEVVVV